MQKNARCAVGHSGRDEWIRLRQIILKRGDIVGFMGRIRFAKPAQYLLADLVHQLQGLLYSTCTGVGAKISGFVPFYISAEENPGIFLLNSNPDVRITLAAGRAHEKHTVGGDFREATYRAVRNGLMQARAEGKAVLLEPWCEYEIELPARSVGRAMTDIRQMGGSQDMLEQAEDTAKIKGRVPASEISGYQLTLSGYTSGAGRLSLTPCGYDECHNASSVIDEKGYDPERDVENPADSVFVNHSGSDIVRWNEVASHMHIGSVLKLTFNTLDSSAVVLF